MDFETIVEYLNTETVSYRSDFEALFNEYVSERSVDVNPIKIIDQLFDLPYFHGFICFVDNKPASFAVCYESYSTDRAKKILNIHDVMVSKRFRGKGIGQVMLQSIEQYCIENGYIKMTLEVDSGNLAAKKLYSSCGYEDYQVEQEGLLHWQKYLL